MISYPIQSFYIGQKLGESIGLGFTTTGRVTPSALKGSTPYSRITDKWFYYDYQTGTERVTSQPLRFGCISNTDHRVCSTRVLEFSENVRQERENGEFPYINKYGDHYYTQV